MTARRGESKGVRRRPEEPARAARRPDMGDPRTILRHRPPLLLVDEVAACTPGRWLVARWRPGARWPVFRGHFPDEPIVPGVLLIEAIGQASALLAFATQPFDVRRTRMYLVTVERARFRARVGPHGTLEIRTDLVDRRGPLWRFEGSIAYRGQVAAEARLVAALLAPGDAGRRAGRRGG